MPDDARFWDRMAPRYHASKRSTGMQEAIDATIEVLGGDDVVLDVGCGSGPVSVALRPHVRAVHGIDISPEMIRLAKDSAGDGLDFEVGSIDAPGLDERGFTAIVAFNVLHYLDLGHAMRRFHDLLPSGGRLIILAACVRDINPFIRAGVAIVGALMRMPTMHRFRRTDLEAMVDAAGFDVIESRLHEDWSKVQWIVAQRR